jgi:DNA-binding transcriptional MerR regulator
MAGIKIGEVARRCAVSPDTIRHYEKRGLIPPPSRTPSGYRQYSEDDVIRVQQIRRALALGFSLRELASIFAIRRAGGTPCRKTLGILEDRLAETERRLLDLAALYERMQTTAAEWRSRIEAAGPDRPARLLEHS